MRVRPEEPADVDAVRGVHLAAFATLEPGAAPAVEARLTDALRDGGHLLPALTLVAVEGGTVVGHVAGSRGTVGGEPVVALGPIGVRPDRQGIGIGAALVQGLLDRADRLGERAVILLGDPAYYGPFGFRDARTVGVEAPDPSWGEHFQLCPLSAWDGHPLSGRAAYAPPFDDV